MVQSLLISIEIDQQDHESVWMAIHVVHVVGQEPTEYLGPASRRREHLDPSENRKIQTQTKPGRYLMVGIVLGKHEDMCLLLIGSHFILRRHELMH